MVFSANRTCTNNRKLGTRTCYGFSVRKIIKLIVFRCLVVFGMRWRRSASNGEKPLYLTFDDGPNPDFTPQVLAILERHGARASFFLIGEMCEQHPDLVSRISSEGHTLGNHSYDHSDLKRAAWSEIRHQIEATDRYIRRNKGGRLPCIRPPKGLWGLKYLLYVATGFRKTYLWSVDPKDFACRSSSEVLRRIDLESLRAGDIILLHDKSAATVDAVRQLVPELQRRGFALHGLEHHPIG